MKFLLQTHFITLIKTVINAISISTAIEIYLILYIHCAYIIAHATHVTRDEVEDSNAEIIRFL